MCVHVFVCWQCDRNSLLFCSIENSNYLVACAEESNRDDWRTRTAVLAAVNALLAHFLGLLLAEDAWLQLLMQDVRLQLHWWGGGNHWLLFTHCTLDCSAAAAAMLCLFCRQASVPDLRERW